jgi:hypothetical protein
VDVGSIADVLEVHADSVFWIGPEGGDNEDVTFVKYVMI